jgi:hypothetical protein
MLIDMKELCQNKKDIGINLANWSLKKFGLTANIDTNIEIDKSHNPLLKKYHEVDDKNYDLRHLQHFCQVHNCSKYCLRLELSSSQDRANKLRTCRMGAGTEKTPNKSDTTFH